ncbi:MULTISPECIES: DUF6463 family protein [Mycolicibacterium]|uniref:DUF6463 family protein n=1 Tax=Mycolicibacterium TaxID=1866885 RepID=UPI002574865E|nr:DUF6463 family protein [Mycolicibacterium mageritense]
MNARNITAWGGRLAVVGAVAHVSLAAKARKPVWSQIADEGIVNTVTLEPTPEQLDKAEAFWFSPGSFGVPFGLLGALVLHMTRRGQPVPRWLGWTIAAWAGVAGVMLPKSGAWAIFTAGALLIAGNRKSLSANG